MSQRRDLTRWNRAGLERFRYVDGNAATYLEDLRLAFEARFSEWSAVQQSVDPLEEPVARLERLLDQYGADRRDWGWELARSFARAGHVLGEYLDAYANEGYLGTATQWENVRRLVEMLDYHPAPPASASTPVVLLAKDELSGAVEKGLQIKHTPATGGPPVIFETLEDLDIDASLNALRLAEYDRSPDRVSGATLLLDAEPGDIEVGDPLVVEDERTGLLEARLIEGVEAVGEQTRVTLVEPLQVSSGFTRGYVHVHVEAADTLDPLGPFETGAELGAAVQLEEPPGDLRAGEIVFISDGKEQLYRRVRRVDGRRLVLDRAVGPLRLDGAFVSRARLIAVSDIGGREGSVSVVRVAGDLSAMTGARIAELQTSGGSSQTVELELFAADYDPVDPESPESGGFTTLRISDANRALRNPQNLYVPPATRDFEVDSYLRRDGRDPLPRSLVASEPKKATAGDLAVVTRGRQLAWCRLSQVSLDADAGQATLSTTRWRHRSGSPFYLAETRVHTHFKRRERLAGWNLNSTPVSDGVLPLDEIPEALQRGRKLFLERLAGDTVDLSVAATVSGLDRSASQVTIEPPLAADAGWTRANLRVRANVVQAGHGEARPPKVLGSGDAARSHQAFVLEETDVSFVADPLQPSGVRADVEVEVQGRRWGQAANLRESSAADAHYEMRMTEDGYVRVQFGDGAHGRRLPTGTNNVRIGFRVGTGLAGNVAAGSLSKLARPHPLVDKVIQPLAATGGNDLEPLTSLRENAPASVLTLERAVSLADFTHLAQSHASVWQARALSQPTRRGRHDNVEVVVVPPDGGLLGGLADELRLYLESHALPGVEVEVTDFEPMSFSVEVTFQVKSAERDPDEVTEAVRAALLEQFSLRRRRLGQALYASEIVRTVEGVAGVENSRTSLPGGPVLRTSARQLRFLAPSGAGLILEAREFAL